jgi:hypothetical protein
LIAGFGVIAVVILFFVTRRIDASDDELRQPRAVIRTP